MPKTRQCDVPSDIVKEYYEAVRCANYFDVAPMKEFIAKYPKEYKHLNAVHHKRVLINSNIEAMRYTNRTLYFGCLTFDKKKDQNKIECKRKEAFAYLNSLFEFVLLVEELGEKKGRYHVHFIGDLKDDKTFDDFRKGWHSRQNLRVLQENEHIGWYLAKYVGKELPRIRRNKKLIALEREVRQTKPLQRTFKTTRKKMITSKVLQLTVFDV